MRFHKTGLIALALAVLLLGGIVALPVAAEAQPTPVPATPAPPVPTAAQVAVGEQVITNLHLFELLAYGGHNGILQNESIAAMPVDDQNRLGAMFDEEIAAHRAETVHAMATSNSGYYTTEQLGQLLALSKIKYVQDLVLAGGDTSLATPDETSMTEAERTLFTTMMNEAWVNDFFEQFDYTTATPTVGAAADAAFNRFSASTPAQ